MEDMQLTITKEKQSPTEGRFVLGPLPTGYGVTLGTSLRRVLLSSLPGGAITEVRIAGVSHPFTALKGVKEDVVEMLLNLKKIRFTLSGDGPFEATVEVKGKKSVSAEDMKVSSEVKVATPKAKIATLTDSSSKLSLNLLIEKGTGYRPAEDRESGKVGVIPLDAVFSPVVNVSFTVEETRVGRETNLDRLVLDVTTDGTIAPAFALEEAAKTLTSYFGKIAGEKEAKPKKAAKATDIKEDTSDKVSDEVRKMAIADLKVSPRTLNTLEDGGIKTVGGLLQKSAEELTAMKGFGATGLKEIQKSLTKLGASLKE